VSAWVAALALAAGLGAVAGARPSLTLAVVGGATFLDWGLTLAAPFAFLGAWPAIVVFVVLAMLESAFDKIARIDRVQDRLSLPYRLLAGAVAGGATIATGWAALALAVAVGAAAAGLANATRQLSRPRSAPSEQAVVLMSAAEDIAAFLVALLCLAQPYAGACVAGGLAVANWRLREWRRAKYRRLGAVARRRPAG
jgi:uncharacterized membrane protein